MWVFLEHPKYWGGATLFLHSDNISDHFWKKRNDLPHLPPKVDPENTEQLAQTIRDYFFKKEGRGRNCKVEVYRRYEKEYFFAYPDGSVKAFVTCDQLDYMGPVLIPPNNLKQWQITEKQVAEWIGCELGIRSKPKKDKDTRSFLIGNVQGKKRAGSLELVCGEQTSLKTSDHFLPLNEVVFLDEDQLTLDGQAIFNMIERPPSSNRYKPSIARREVNKLDTQTRHKVWQKAYRELKRKNSDRSDNWCALQITKMPIGKGKSKETIRKNMKKV